MLDQPRAGRKLVELRLAVNAAMQRGREIEAAQVEYLAGELVSRQREDIVSEKQPAGSQGEDPAHLLDRGAPSPLVTIRSVKLSALHDGWPNANRGLPRSAPRRRRTGRSHTRRTSARDHRRPAASP